MTAGRPLIFNSPQELEAAIESYFESCWEEVWIERPKLDTEAKPIFDERKEKVTEWVPKLSRTGKQILRQMHPYTLGGLAVALNCSRQTLLNYKERQEYTDASAGRMQPAGEPIVNTPNPNFDPKSVDAKPAETGFHDQIPPADGDAPVVPGQPAQPVAPETPQAAPVPPVTPDPAQPVTPAAPAQPAT